MPPWVKTHEGSCRLREEVRLHKGDNGVHSRQIKTWGIVPGMTLQSGSVPSGETANAKVAGAFGMVTGILVILYVVGFVFIPSSAQVGETTLSAFESSSSLYYFGLVISVLLALLAVPYFTALGRLLRPRGAATAAAATYLSIIGLFLYAASMVLYVALLSSIQGAAGNSNPATAAFVANVVGTSSADLTLLGGAAWTFGLFLYAILSWRSRIVPNWLAIVGLVGGVAGFLSFMFGVVGGAMGFVFAIAFVIWAFGSGLVFLGPYLRPKVPRAG